MRADELRDSRDSEAREDLEAEAQFHEAQRSSRSDIYKISESKVAAVAVSARAPQTVEELSEQLDRDRAYALQRLLERGVSKERALELLQKYPVGRVVWTLLQPSSPTAIADLVRELHGAEVR